jgi:hypothetical protein
MEVDLFEEGAFSGDLSRVECAHNGDLIAHGTCGRLQAIQKIQEALVRTDAAHFEVSAVQTMCADELEISRSWSGQCEMVLDPSDLLVTLFQVRAGLEPRSPCQ